MFKYSEFRKEKDQNYQRFMSRFAGAGRRLNQNRIYGEANTPQQNNQQSSSNQKIGINRGASCFVNQRLEELRRQKQMDQAREQCSPDDVQKYHRSASVSYEDNESRSKNDFSIDQDNAVLCSVREQGKKSDLLTNLRLQENAPLESGRALIYHQQKHSGNHFDLIEHRRKEFRRPTSQEFVKPLSFEEIQSQLFFDNESPNHDQQIENLQHQQQKYEDKALTVKLEPQNIKQQKQQNTVEETKECIQSISNQSSDSVSNKFEMNENRKNSSSCSNSSSRVKAVNAVQTHQQQATMAKQEEDKDEEQNQAAQLLETVKQNWALFASAENANANGIEKESPYFCKKMPSFESQSDDHNDDNDHDDQSLVDGGDFEDSVSETSSVSQRSQSPDRQREDANEDVQEMQDQQDQQEPQRDHQEQQQPQQNYILIVLQELARRDQIEPNSPMSVNLHPSDTALDVEAYKQFDQNASDDSDAEDFDDEIPEEGEVASPVKEKKILQN